MARTAAAPIPFVLPPEVTKPVGLELGPGSAPGTLVGFTGGRGASLGPFPLPPLPQEKQGQDGHAVPFVWPPLPVPVGRGCVGGLMTVVKPVDGVAGLT